ncbi:alpha/beta-hydrolase [Teratosphaeria nubilosa]|uniref:Alpha/beta-hydrolase n=1 Tax=Teratosphaeria nubilosa TaxID=161662 RepID=A0A6G1L547_9PEZI|nr:alpha/beta-hydrolase [Teratosphaeria nubilosa]
MSSYQISVSEDKIQSLKQKLEIATFPDELDTAAWDYGAPLGEVKRLAQVWRDSYDWRQEEAKLNALPNFHRPITVDGFGALDIHYLHQPSDSPDAIPLLFCHGWPGSYIEVTKLLAGLKQSHNGVSFHVVAPSLPNFGWSEGVKQKGFGLQQYAEVNHRLMKSLGYDKYVTQGGDWGFYITRAMGLLYPEAIPASHINMIRASPPSWTSNPLLALQHSLKPYSERERKGLERTRWFLEEGSGYRTLQATKPQTLGYSLTDSPVGLLAWLLEKLHDWTDNYPWTDDEVLGWVSIYAFSTAGPAASLRIYYEATHAPSGGVSRDRTQQWIPKVKLGLCHAPKELGVVPSTWARTLGPVVYEDIKPRGGHFAAHEIPEEIVKDLRKMFGKGGPCYRVVEPAPKL